ncbi:MAG: rane bound O-acyl transferase family protein [Geminicoccaceae bacterium]|nr:rane bound O-acyl transferase family protein [Geminicoccaceae bacterium]
MLFTRLEFILFAAVFLAAFHLLPRPARLPLALAASYLFYGWSDWRQVLLLLAVSAGTHLTARAMTDAADRIAARRWLLLGVAGNLLLLGTFKYADFLIGAAEDAARLWGWQPGLARLDLVLPLGISFYVFQAVGYLIDVHRRAVPAERNALHLGVFIALFPQLVAGPILRAGSMLPQLDRLAQASWAGAARGVELIAWGFFLKLCLADNAAPVVDRRFADPGAFGAADHLLGTVLFAFQIYGDFAGYSLIAIGLGRLMGFDFGINFARPYFAAGIGEFWRRWHISLSSWMRDYVYIPLGGNRRGGWLTARNLMLTMLIAGIWHGAGWTFLLWGVLHGIALVMERVLPGRPADPAAGLLAAGLRPFRMALTFAFVCLGWILFRADSLGDAAQIVSALATWRPSTGIAGAEQMFVWRAVLAIGVVLLVDALAEWRAVVATYLARPALRILGLALLCWSILLLGRFEGAEFIYFRF